MFSWSSHIHMCEFNLKKKKTRTKYSFTERQVLFVIPFNPYLKYNYNCALFEDSAQVVYNFYLDSSQNKRLELVLNRLEATCYLKTSICVCTPTNF